MTPQTRTVNALQRMRQGLPLLTGLLLLLLSFGPARSDLLASYEPSETTALTLSSPDPGMSVVWPVPGGEEGAPDATSFRNCEKASCGRCGLGLELLLLLPGLTWAHRRRRR